ncbi:TrbC family F-type conjugative pilus assembly protein [Thiomonas sp.]
MRASLFTLGLLSAWLPGQAQAAELSAATKSFLQEGRLPAKKEPNMQYVPQYARPLYQNLNPQQLTPAQLQGMKDAQHILKTTPLIPASVPGIMSQPWAKALGKRGAGIANAAMAANREKILKFLGFKPQQVDKLFYFVSFSMPLSMLRAYAEEAMWDGGVLVFRGPLLHVPLPTFITKDLYQLVGGKGASAAISLDPRLYDAFHITMVPTVVYSTVPENRLCAKVHQHPFVFDKKTWDYPVCDRANAKRYWKIEGAVTSQYALRQFKKAGAPGVSVYIRTLAKGGFGTGPQAQEPYAGKWDAAPTPEQLQAIQQTVSSFGQSVYKTPYGIGIGPKMTVTPGHGIEALATGAPPEAQGESPSRHTAVVQGRAYTAP